VWVLPLAVEITALSYGIIPRHEQLRDRSTMPDIEPDKFRHKAQECRRNAEQARSPIDREAWLRLAEDWVKLARGDDLKRASKPSY
jgi:uncharacterized alpha-E superfamily protein